jgi:biopolymer transport protein ExbD
MRRRRSRLQGEVELNLAAMLDMAFQLLAFFILTFKPSPIEGQISLHLPPPKPVTDIRPENTQIGSNESDPVAGLNTLVISAFADEDGQIGSLAIGDSGVDSLQQLEGTLSVVLSDPGNPFDQILIQVGSKLRYDALMEVMEVCTRQTLPDGRRLSKLSFVELPDAPAGM